MTHCERTSLRTILAWNQWNEPELFFSCSSLPPCLTVTHWQGRHSRRKHSQAEQLKKGRKQLQYTERSARHHLLFPGEGRCSNINLSLMRACRDLPYTTAEPLLPPRTCSFINRRVFTAPCIQYSERKTKRSSKKNLFQQTQRDRQWNEQLNRLWQHYV